MKLGIIILAIALIAIIYIFLKRHKKISSAETRVFSISSRSITPRGVSIWIEDGAVIDRKDLDAIESGLINAFAKAVCVGYTKALNLSDYVVAILADPIRAPESGILCYKEPAGQYAGSSWDLGGYILVSGQVIAIGKPYGNIIAIPEHNGQDLEQLALVCEYEAEHIILAWNDGDRYEATKIHGVGQGHPLIPGCPE